MPGSLRVVLVASEVVPFAKTCGLADVTGALPVALAGSGHQVSVIMPRYPAVERAVRSLEKCLRVSAVPMGCRTESGQSGRRDVQPQNSHLFHRTSRLLRPAESLYTTARRRLCG